jgi:uncharacterized protein YdbL (DUF1318 family)
MRSSRTRRGDATSGRRIWLGAMLLAAAVPACITVNVYFPAPEVRRAAEEIVEETWGGSDGSGVPAATPESQSWLDLLGPPPAYAQGANIDISTPAIAKLKGSIAARAPKLKPYLGAGNVGIGRDGLLVVRKADGLALKDQATVRQLVDAENRDRLALYREIAKANDFGDNRVAEIQQIFAKTWIQKAEKGWWIQNDAGQWTQR